MAKENNALREFEEALTSKKFAPVYLLCGEEDFLVEEAARDIVDAALSPGEREFNLDVLYAGEIDARDIVARASSFPMMTERRVVVVRAVERLHAKDLELLASYVDQPSPSTCLVLVGSKADLRKKPWSSIHRKNAAVEFKPLWEDRLPAWINSRVAKQNRKIDPEAARLLAAYVGSSLRELQNELDKLYIYIGNRTAIAEADVTAVVGISKEFSVFELQKSVGRKDVRRATEIYLRMLEAGEGVPFIIAMLFGYFTTLWKLADLQRRGVGRNEQIAETHIYPRFAQDFYDALALYSMEEIEKAFEYLTIADEQAKSSVDSAQVMESLLVALMVPVNSQVPAVSA